MRKTSAFLLIATLGLGALAGCGKADSASASGSGTTATSETSESAKSTYEQIKENGYITFATEGTYSPYSYHDDKNELVGFDVEVAKAVAEKLGVEAKFTETQWDGIIAGLDANKYDAIANQVSITEERQEKYLFSDPYTYAYGAVVVNGDNNDINSFEDLKGKNVALT
ncbi:MAG: transporter substrate-binding domain-containing protein, partial [Lachnospiraceae bacterium]|nr:transporter substrate-binding domain-containing protein [Lachnospiraceae bacterium]